MTRWTRDYGFGIELAVPYDQAVSRVRDALAKKLDVEFRPYVILGACNPPLAHRALTAERDIGLLLPCNVVVYAGDEEGTSVVGIMDPEAALSLAGNDAIAPLASDVKQRMERVLGSLAS
jgi:uncharacterized protein (DUF302 family)